MNIIINNLLRRLNIYIKLTSCSFITIVNEPIEEDIVIHPWKQSMAVRQIYYECDS
jgi:hypothetical protein